MAPGYMLLMGGSSRLPVSGDGTAEKPEMKPVQIGEFNPKSTRTRAWLGVGLGCGSQSHGAEAVGVGEGTTLGLQVITILEMTERKG